MKTYKIILGVLLFVGLLTSCTDENELIIEEEQLIELAFGENEGTEITLSAAAPLFVGYNTISVVLKNAANNSPITNAIVSVMPMMHLMDMSHSCPVINNTSSINENGQYTFDVVFVMPSGDMGSWEITFVIEHDGELIEIIVPVTVIQPSETRLMSFVSMTDETTKYFVAYIDPKTPQVGENNLELAVYKKSSMMNWPAVEGITFELEPWMTTMEHSSSNNIAPFDVGDGYYSGKVNFTMTGDWEIRLTAKIGGEVIGTPIFNTTFQ